MEFRTKKMRNVNNEKRKKTNKEKNITAKSRNNQNAWRRWKLQVLWIIGNGHRQISGDERKKKERVPQTNDKISRNQALQQESYQKDKYQGCHPCRILGAIFEIDEGRTSTYGP